MRCRQCGYNVDNEKAFCPICGSPMKVTADYDYIQAEIANKVDRYISDDDENNVTISEKKKEKSEKEPVELSGLTVIGDGEVRPAAAKVVHKEKKTDEASPKKSNKSKKNQNRSKSQPKKNKITSETAESIDVSRTKDLKLKDSIYDENGQIASKKKAVSQAYQPQKATVKRSTTLGVVITALIIVLIIAAAVLGILAVLGTFSEEKTKVNVNSTDLLTTNIIDGRTYDEPLEIKLSSTHGNTIYYTVDGSVPTPSSSRYSGPFNLYRNEVSGNRVTFRAVSYSEDSTPAGEIAISFYFDGKITGNALNPAPEISPADGSFSEDTFITVTTEDAGTIYYTYDGSMPTEESSVYTGPVQMKPGTRTFRAISIDNGVWSEVASATYTLEYDVTISSGEAMDNILYELQFYGYISDSEGNTYDGGKAVIDNLGIYEIGQYSYYVFQIDFFTPEGSYDYSIYRGVGTNYGGVSEMGKDGELFYVN